MHLIVSWDTYGTEAVQKALGDDLREQLKGFSWVRPLSDFYIVKLGKPEDREVIRERLVGVARRRKELNQRVNMVISPVIVAGAYSGFLPKDMWGEDQQANSARCLKSCRSRTARNRLDRCAVSQQTIRWPAA